MTVTQIQKRNGRSQQLKVIRLAEGQFAVESSQGKIMYLVSIDEQGQGICTCADYIRNIRIDNHFRCKHILAVIDCEGSFEEAEVLQKKTPKIDSRFIKNINGKEFCLYAGLLDYAHQKGLLKLQCEIVQLPNKDNEHEAICRAVAETKYGEIYEDIGDANSKNTNKMISAHIIRMASTRAKARCLRDLCNIGMTCLEELGDLDEVIGENNEDSISKKNQKAIPKKQAIEQDRQIQTKNTAHQIQSANTEDKKTSPYQQDTSVSHKPTVEKEINNAKNTAKATPVTNPVNTTSTTNVTPTYTYTFSATSNMSKVDNKESEKNNGKDNTSVKVRDSEVMTISEAQKRATINLAKRRGISSKELDEMIMNTYGLRLDELTMTQASSFIRELQSVA